MVFIVF